jgi:DNA-binding NarL/FixJ family response regulator
MIQLSILSDSRLFREVLAARLASEDRLQVVSSAGTVYELLVRAQARPIHILLVYLGVESAIGAEVVWDIKTLLPATRVVVLGSPGGAADTVRWIEAGAMACLDDRASWACLLATIRSVAEGRATYSPEVVCRLVRRMAELGQVGPGAKSVATEPLSDRETEVAQLIALGLMSKQVARRLGVKTPTVKSHLRSIFRKRNLKGRRDLI